MKRILLLGSGELGKEFTISAKRLGCHVVACDSYLGAPAMQVADGHQVFDMLDGEMLGRVIDTYKPDLIVPEVEAIRTEVLLEKEAQGYTVVPTARATNLTMNRDRIRDRAVELGLRTAKFEYAEDLETLQSACRRIGFPCVVKPVMSSSGKGQSVVNEERDVDAAWKYAVSGMRGDRQRVIVEEFIDFDLELTLLTVKQHNGPTLFCPLIGHYQERGDYQYSWQPALEQTFTGHIIETHAQEMAKIITDDLGGAGIFGVEFFVKTKGNSPEVIFSELSPRPHDTGMVTMFTQNLSEFDLHARAILGLPIGEIKLVRPGASHVVLAHETTHEFIISGINDALKIPDVDVRVFGKPTTRPYRRMAVVLAPSLDIAKEAASKISVIDIASDTGL
jgi:phosphoribosylglycinamide formyltransferase 2